MFAHTNYTSIRSQRNSNRYDELTSMRLFIENDLYVLSVKGEYEYCHYLYDGTDDRGWGCGYRTLQTIISWIQHNSRTELTVPSIKKIQEILVEVS